MTAPPDGVDVGALRRRLRAQRRSLDAATQHDHAATAAVRALEIPELAAAGSVGVYLADDGELDPMPLSERLEERGAAVHLPVVDEDEIVRFRSWDVGSRLVPGRWGIAVPPEPSTSRTADEVDVVITPLVATDRHGTRIGRGAGYYDRTLAHRLEGDGRPLVIGYAHQLQLAEVTLPRRAWDVPLDVLVTEREVRRWRSDRT